MRNKLVLGFKLGALIGGTFGTVIGAYYSFAYRSIIYLPAFALSSGMSFGFFMAIGTVVRSDSWEAKDPENMEFVKVWRSPSGELKVKRGLRYSE